MTKNESVGNGGLASDAGTKMAPIEANGDASTSPPCIILFYKYHPLSDDPSIVELYRLALERFCIALDLRGRILVGCSEHRSEGINGTLSGTKSSLQTFVKALRKENSLDDEASLTFRTECETFYKAANCQPLQMDESEFKWSELAQKNVGDEIQTSEELFPDLNIKIVNELIGTGGVLSSIKIDECHKGYLTPQEWHERIGRLQAKKEKASEGNAVDEEEEDTILIDCRNTKECAIGNFVGSIDPLTTTFNQFPKWVDDHKHKLRNKSVLMYCTGGIRCEKASAYVRHAMGASVKEVRHLKGGIHKYLEAYGEEKELSSGQNATTPLWRGKNFVFDGRGAHGPEDSSESNPNSDATKSANAKTSAVGSCRYCEAPYDSFDPHCVCTVCKEPILVCKACQAYPGSCEGEKSTNHEEQTNRPQHLHEYHCVTHKHLENCYFTNLEGFSLEELKNQLLELGAFYQDIAVGKKFRQRRKTLAKQRSKIEARLNEMGMGEGCVNISSTSNESHESIELKCRNCGQVGCSGKCWGFHGLKRKRVLDQKEGGVKTNQQIQGKDLSSTPSALKNNQNKRLKQQKEQQKQKIIDEWIASGLTLGPKSGRDTSTGLRVPKPCVRVLESTTKGKWCGRSLLKVLQTEFPNSFQVRDQQKPGDMSETTESETENTLRTLLRKRLIRVNGTPIETLDAANNYKLKNMDVIDRIVLWHEPPIHLPSETIKVQKISIPEIYLPAAKIQQESEATIDNHIYVCDKPSTVPVHPAGPYLSNSLTMLVEAQEGLRPKTLIPCHRIDRVTSGMTICCTNTRVAKLIQTTMATKTNNGGSDVGPFVSKQYLARVKGRFPSNENDDASSRLPILSNASLARWEWTAHDKKNILSWNGLGSNGSTPFLQVNGPIETVDPLNGVRKITSNGKTSTSLFQFIKYDAESDTSIIACIPITGRSHQLRVHLQWLGHSIVNDIQYGGIVATVIDPSAGVQRMVDNVRDYSTTNNDTNHPSSITNEQAQAARDVCPVCDIETEGNGPSSAFSPAQLLQGGHAICLHAYRYSMSFPSIANKESNDVFRVDMKVDLPPWASHLQIGSR